MLAGVPSGLVSHLGKALFHAAVHIAGHETFHHIKHKISGHWLRNHDVSRALNESYIAALNLMEREYKRSDPPSADRERAAAALKRLRARAAEWFPVGKDALISDEEASRIFADEGISGRVSDSLAADAAEAPAAFRDLLRRSFADAFVFAFKELGLKGNEKVRAVVTQSTLEDLRAAVSLSNAKLDEVRAAMGGLGTILEQNEDLKAFQVRFAASIELGLREITDQVGRVAAAQEEIKGMLHAALSGDAKVLGYLTISDKTGKVIDRHALRKPLITIGREQDNDVRLAHGGVSGRHAEIRFDGGSIEIRDLKSKHGTYVDEAAEPVRQAKLRFGQKIRIRPFVLELLSPEAGEPLFESPLTAPLDE